MTAKTVAWRVARWFTVVATLATLSGAAAAGLWRPPQAAALETSTPQSGQISSDITNVGRNLFVQACSTCHGLDGQGSSRGPTIVGVGTASVDWWLSTGRMPLAAPGRQTPRKPPAFNDQQRAAIVAYVAALGPGGVSIPAVNLATASLASGSEVFRANCAACHGAAGVGGALSYGAYAPPLSEATPLQVAEAIRIGPGNMPVFNERALSDQDVQDVTSYVSYLRHPSDRGGAGLGHIGPLAEGFVGLLFGVAGLMLVSYWIGDRTGAAP